MTPAPTIIQGIPCYAPELARSEDTYPSENFERLFHAEDNNFWFRSRNRLLARLVAKHLGSQPARMLEIGCGTGYVLRKLSNLTSLKLVGAERHLEGLVWARQRLPGVEFVQLDATRLPFESAFDAVGAFDVIEHIEEDQTVLAGAHRALKSQGFLFLTVPQHRFLWSETDRLAQHKRRYTRQEIVGKLHLAGFKVRFCTSFVTSLFPVMIVSRWFKSGSSQKTHVASELCELHVPKYMDKCLELGMRVDEALIGAGLSLPFGGSLMIAAQKEKF